MGRNNSKNGVKTAFKNHMKGIKLSSDGTLRQISDCADTYEDGHSLHVNEDTAKICDADGMPKKRFFRTRAHCNPLSHNDGFAYPNGPKSYDWSIHFPSIGTSTVDFLDIGMGFGGLTVALAKLFPDKYCLGMEIRAKVCEYVRLRVDALRKENAGEYENASCLRTNCMRYLPNFFKKGSIEKVFFCFPDPHFKAKNHRRRIVNDNLLTEYAYIMAPAGLLYTITDVEELHKWHVEKCTNHPSFERVSDEDLCNDLAIKAMIEETEEGKKVTRNNGRKFFAVFRKIDSICLMESLF